MYETALKHQKKIGGNLSEQVRRAFSGKSHSTVSGYSGLAQCSSAIYLPNLAHSPNFEITGSFFPAWLIALVIGIILMVVARGLTARAGLAEQIRPAVLVCLRMALAFTFATWLILV